MTNGEPTVPKQALARMLDYCAREAEDQNLPVVEYLIRAAIKELGTEAAGAAGTQIAAAMRRSTKR
jgi:hypothetical protein